MKNHFMMMLVFSILTSLVLAFIVKAGNRERAKYFLYLLGSFVGLSLIAGWLMYPFPFK
jgi:cytochrome bd-type quinol oxidase subunit 2